MSVTSGPEIPDSGLILHLDASNPKSYPGSGTTWYDLSGNGNHGTLNGYVSNPVFSYRFGGSFYFNGLISKSYIQCNTTNNITNLTDLTVILWGMLDDFSGLFYGRYYAFDSRITSTANGVGIGLDKETATTASPFSFVADATGADESNGPTTFTKSTMYMFAITRSGTSIQVTDSDSYTLVSPALVSNKLGTGAVGLNGYRIGAYFGVGAGATNYTWPGYITAVYAYNRVLSQVEMTQHYNAARSRFNTPAEIKSGLILNLDAGDSSSYSGSGSTWTDLSGRGYHATIYNNPPFTSNGTASYFTINNGVTNQTMQSSVPKPLLPVTISFWVYPLDVAGNKLGLFDTAPNTQNTLRAYNGNVEWRNVDPAVAITSSVANNNWYNIVAVYDFTTNRQLSVYINGRLIGSSTGSTNSTLAWTSFIFGNNNGGVAGSFYGRVAKITIHNRALSAFEIGNNFDALRGRYGV